VFGFEERWQLSTGTSLRLQSDTLVLFKLAQPSVVWLGRRRDEPGAYLLQPGVWLLAQSSKDFLRFESATPYKRVKTASLCSLLAFVDTAMPNGDHLFSVSSAQWVSIPKGAAECVERFESWLLGQALSGDNPLLAWLRTQEAYSLLIYLLNNYRSSGQLKELCMKYGVSYSYFRKLCRDMLGVAAKSKLREWRAAKSVLDIVEGRGSILEIALRNGYASASHIASDLKREFGIKPTAFINAEQLLMLDDNAT
jgi:AraC-like DNA-binding protein